MQKLKFLEPAYIGPRNNYHYYDDGSCFLAILLVKLRGFGFTIQEMLSVMEDESFTHLEDLLIQKRKNIQMQGIVSICPSFGDYLQIFLRL